MLNTDELADLGATVDVRVSDPRATIVDTVEGLTRLQRDRTPDELASALSYTQRNWDRGEELWEEYAATRTVPADPGDRNALREYAAFERRGVPA